MQIRTVHYFWGWVGGTFLDEKYIFFTFRLCKIFLPLVWLPLQNSFSAIFSLRDFFGSCPTPPPSHQKNNGPSNSAHFAPFLYSDPRIGVEVRKTIFSRIPKSTFTTTATATLFGTLMIDNYVGIFSGDHALFGWFYVKFDVNNESVLYCYTL